MARRKPELETLTALQDTPRVDVGRRTVADNGDGSLRTVIPREICRARDLEEGDEIIFRWDPEREEIIIPVSEGAGERL